MAKRSVLPRVAPLPLGAQLIGMRAKHPQLKYVLFRSTVTWEGPWTVSELSDEYMLRVRYKYLHRPVISILIPRLELAHGHLKLPHTYADGQMDICVHIPGQWTSNLLIADTIMPWVSQWVYFYEAWRQTGVWLGKGTHPKLPQHSEAA